MTQQKDNKKGNETESVHQKQGSRMSRRKLLGVAGSAAVTGLLLGNKAGLSYPRSDVVGSVYGNAEPNRNGNATGIRSVVEEMLQESNNALEGAVDARMAEQADTIVSGAVINGSQTKLALDEGYLYELNAVDWGVPNDGVSLADVQIKSLLRDNQQYERIYFPAGTYLMGDQVSLARTRSLHVRCHSQAIFRFIDHVATETNKKVMFQMFGDRTVTTDATVDFYWEGGVIDGNDANQGDENLASWDNYDTCKGMKIARFRNAELSKIKVKEFRGHGVNHWNNHSFYAHDCVIDQAISARKPEGGTRRDGISGSSNVTRYERITGFAADDLVAVAVGAASPPKGFSGWSTWDSDVDLFIAKDIRAVDKKDNNSITRNTWAAVSVHLLNGYKVKEAHINGVYGNTYSGLVRAGGYQTGYYGSIDHFNLSDVYGDTTGENAQALFKFGGTSFEAPVAFKKVSIRRVTRQISRSGPTNPNILFAYANVLDLSIDDVTVEYGASSTGRGALIAEVGNGLIKNLRVNNARVYDLGNPANPALLIYEKNVTVEGTTKFFANNIDLGSPGNSSARTTFVVVGVGKVIPFGLEIVTDYSHSSVGFEPGAMCTDKIVGALRVDHAGNWKQMTKPTNQWNSSTFGKPASGLWKVGFENVVTGSPMGACLGYRCITEGVGSAASFIPIAPPNMTEPASLKLDFIPTSANTTPGTIISREVGSSEGASFPGGQAGIFTMYVGRTSLAWTYQTYQRRDTGQVYRRVWNGSAWTAFI